MRPVARFVGIALFLAYLTIRGLKKRMSIKIPAILHAIVVRKRPWIFFSQVVCVLCAAFLSILRMKGELFWKENQRACPEQS